MNMVINADHIKTVRMRDCLCGKASWIFQRWSVLEGVIFRVENVAAFSVDVNCLWFLLTCYFPPKNHDFVFRNLHCKTHVERNEI